MANPINMTADPKSTSVKDRLVELIAKQLDIVDTTVITPETILRGDPTGDPDAKDLNVGSLELADILIAIDTEFGVSILDESVENIRTIQDLVDYIETHQS